MAVAKIYPTREKGGRGRTASSKTSEILGGFSNDRLNQARTVLTMCSEMVDAIIGGSLGLDEAYAEAQRRERRGRDVPCISTHRALQGVFSGRARVAIGQHVSRACRVVFARIKLTRARVARVSQAQLVRAGPGRRRSARESATGRSLRPAARSHRFAARRR